MIRVGIVGGGFMGKMHAQVYAALPDAELVAVADRRSAVADALAAPHGANVYPDLDALLAAESVDVVDICLPTYLHAEHAIKALDAGRHVFCEKPMAMTVADADAMAEAARRNGRQLMIGHCIRFWPEYQYLKTVVDDGRLGALRSIALTRVSPLPTWTWENWVQNEARSGGAALDLHIHDTDYILYLLGAPETLTARGRTTPERGVDHVYATLTYSDGVVAHLEGGWDFPATFPFKMAFRAVFENGAILWDGGPLTVYPTTGDAFAPTIERAETPAGAAGGNISDLGGYYNEIAHFIDALQNNKPLEIVTPESSRLSLETVLEEIRQVKEAENGGVR